MLALRPIDAVAWESPHQLTTTKITQRCNNRLMRSTISDLYNTITQRFSKSLEGFALKVVHAALAPYRPWHFLVYK